MVDHVDPSELPPPAFDGEPDFGYAVTVEAFSGPLDLLLHLVRKTQVDIADIPIATIADAFLATVQSWEAADLDVAGDFILMAATLLEIKSRLVAPPRDPEAEREDDEEDWIDPRADLIRQLLAYRTFKEVAESLIPLELAATERVARHLREVIPEDPDEVDGISLDNADPVALFDAFDLIMARIAGLGPRTVVYDDVPMESRMASVSATMQARGEARLDELLTLVPHRVQKAGMLLAVLECTRQRILGLVQWEQFGAVQIRFRPSGERPALTEGMPEETAAETSAHRRRRPPLVTWQAREGGDAGAEDAPVVDEGPVETDEQRFLRELEVACRLEEVLARGEDLEAGFTTWREGGASAASPETALDAERSESRVHNSSEDRSRSSPGEKDDGGPRVHPVGE